jgi:hypothetical protein
MKQCKFKLYLTNCLIFLVLLSQTPHTTELFNSKKWVFAVRILAYHDMK